MGTKAAPNLSYGTQTYNTGTNTATYLQLQAQSGGFLGNLLLAPSVDGTTTFNFSGGGTLAVGQDFAGDHQKVTDINASGTTGKVYITGAAETATGTSAGTNALGNFTSANPFGLFGSAAGFLDEGTAATGTFALKTFEIGSGQTFLDVSSANLAQVGALTTTPGALVDLNNEIVVNQSVADTISTTTFQNIKGFSVLGIGGSSLANGAGGTINMKNLPAEITTIRYQTSSPADVAINNVTKVLTVDTGSNGNGHALTIGAVGPNPGFNDSLTVMVGNADLGHTRRPWGGHLFRRRAGELRCSGRVAVGDRLPDQFRHRWHCPIDAHADPSRGCDDFGRQRLRGWRDRYGNFDVGRHFLRKHRSHGQQHR